MGETMPQASLVESQEATDQCALRYAKPSEWAAHKALIKKLYLDENKTLDEMRRIMADEHQFRATPSMFKKRIRSWNFLKKLEEDDVLKVLQQKLKKEAAGEHAPPLVIRGRIVRNQRLKRFLERRPETLSRLQAATWSSSAAPTASRWLCPDGLAEVPKVLSCSPASRDMERTLTAIRDYIRACAVGPNPSWKWTPEGYASRKGAAIDLRTSRLEMTRAVDEFYLLQACVDANRPAGVIFQLLNSTLNRLNRVIRTELPDVFFQMIELLQHTWSNHSQLGQIFRRHVAELAMVQLGRNHPMSVLWVHMLRDHGGESFRTPLNVLYMLLQELAVSRGIRDQLTALALDYLLRFVIQTQGPAMATRRFKDWLISYPGWDHVESWSGTIESRLAASRVAESGYQHADHHDSPNSITTTSASAIQYLPPRIPPSEALEAQYCLAFLGGKIALRNGDADRAENWFLRAKGTAKQHEGFLKIDLCSKVITNLRVLYTATEQTKKLCRLSEEIEELKAELPPGTGWPSEEWHI